MCLRLDSWGVRVWVGRQQPNSIVEWVGAGDPIAGYIPTFEVKGAKSCRPAFGRNDSLNSITSEAHVWREYGATTKTGYIAVDEVKTP